MAKQLASIDVYEFFRPRADTYLGVNDPGDISLGQYHFVRKFNGTVYPTSDRSVVVRVVDSDGCVGWGETYGLVAPRVIAELIDELFAPYLNSLGLDDPTDFRRAAYELQRVRGYWGGYLADALAALDIALWDCHARSNGQSLQAALGKPGAGEVPAYVSGLPASTQPERIEMALDWVSKGFDTIKFPISATVNGDVAGEFAALREALGPDIRLAADLHWTLTADQAIKMAQDSKPYDPWFLEAPTLPEDIEAQRRIAEESPVTMALGEEWRSEWDYRQRRGCCEIVQPEMGHTGIAQFRAISELARADGARIIPHATISLGIFMAASLRTSLAVGAEMHEYHPAIYDKNGALLDGAATCANGAFAIPDTPGHGVEPNEDAWQFLTKINSWTKT